MSCTVFFFFNDTATTEIYTLSLHDALPISHPGLRLAVHAAHRPAHPGGAGVLRDPAPHALTGVDPGVGAQGDHPQIGKHTSELQSRQYLVCRLLLEKKNNTRTHPYPATVLT